MAEFPVESLFTSHGLGNRNMTTYETSDCSWWPDRIAKRAYSYCCAVSNTISNFLLTGLAELLVAFISRANWFLYEWGKAMHGS